MSMFYVMGIQQSTHTPRPAVRAKVREWGRSPREFWRFQIAGLGYGERACQSYMVEFYWARGAKWDWRPWACQHYQRIESAEFMVAVLGKYKCE